MKRRGFFAALAGIAVSKKLVPAISPLPAHTATVDIGGYGVAKYGMSITIPARAVQNDDLAGLLSKLLPDPKAARAAEIDRMISLQAESARQLGN